MYAAMQSAPLGESGKGEDPSVNQLQEETAHLLGKEDALFFPTGSQSNCAALLTHCTRGDEIITADSYHIYLLEGAGASVLGGVSFRTLPALADGTLTPDAISAAVRPDRESAPVSRLLSLENPTYGKPINPDNFSSMVAAGRAAGLAVHLDGARIFNAAVALSTTPAALAREADSVSMCLSKGLGAPIGSLLAGERDFIKAAKRWRRCLGGSMRQAGVIAACGRVALEEGPENIAQDHARTANLGGTLSALAGSVGQGRLNVSVTPTNMIFVEAEQADIDSLSDKARARGLVLANDNPLRIVIHRDIADKDIEALSEVFASHFTH